MHYNEEYSNYNRQPVSDVYDVANFHFLLGDLNVASITAVLYVFIQIIKRELNEEMRTL